MPALGEETAPDLSQEGIPKPGDVIAGKYRVERHIGKGGMAAVLAARHVGLDQEVAVKVMHPVVAVDPLPRERFEREAKAAATLQGEHVVRILDVGKLDDGLPYMVMEHLSGVDLSALTRMRGPLPIEEAVEYVLQACEAVAEAHAKGIIHRDLKPSNLFLTKRPDGSPLIKVLDFGIAKIHEDEKEEILQLTHTGMGMGSPQFMSPEQLRDAKTVDQRTDVWSLGVVLYQLLSGITPFQGRTFSSLCATIAADPPTPLRQLRPEVPEPLANVVMRCLEKEVAARVPNVAELARGLLPYASSTSTMSVTRITKILAETHAPQALPMVAGAAGAAARAAGRITRSEPLAPNASLPTLAATLQDRADVAARANHRPTLLAAVGGALCMGLILAAIWASRAGGIAPQAAPLGETPPSPTAAAARPAAVPPSEGTASAATPSPVPPALTASPAPAASPPPASAMPSAAPLAPSLPVGPRPTGFSKKGTRGDPLNDRK